MGCRWSRWPRVTARGAAALGELGLSVGFCIGVLFVLYGFYAFAYAEISGSDPAIAYFSPRFAASDGQAYVLSLLLAGLLLLAFDQQDRDRRERMADVLDARPVSNVAVLFGRLGGIVLAAWLPLAVACVLIELFGFGARASGLGFGEPVEPYAQAAFVLLDALPVMVLWVAVVLFLSTVLRGRLAVLAVAVALIAVQMWAYASAPAYLAVALSPLFTNVGWASDMLPRFADTSTVVQRGAGLLGAGGLVLLGAAMSQRADGVRVRRRVAAGLALVVLGVAGPVWLAAEAKADNRLRSDWLARHQAASETAVPDVARLTGDVWIAPGAELRETIEVDFTAPAGAVAFSLNPGMRIEDLRLNGEPVPFRHDGGLLEIAVRPPLAVTRLHKLEMTAAGVPDTRFAHLDSAVEWRHRSVTNRLGLLGRESLIFDRRYVALMPDAAWLPRAGTKAWSQGHQTDFFTLDLAVHVPGWMVGGRAWSSAPRV